MKDIAVEDLTGAEVISAVEWLETQKQSHLDEIKTCQTPEAVQSWLDNEAQSSWISEEQEFQDLIGACEYALGFYDARPNWKDGLMNIQDKAYEAERMDVFQADCFWKNARWLIDNNVIKVRPVRAVPYSQF